MLNWFPVNFIKGTILYSEIIGLSDYISSKEIVLKEINNIFVVIKGKQKGDYYHRGNGEKTHLNYQYSQNCSPSFGLMLIPMLHIFLVIKCKVLKPE